jgi:shikimate kinase
VAEVNRDQGSSPAIVFIGFMAAGKTRAAEAAAGRLGTTALDADHLIEEELGEPIADFFQREGEAEFRRREGELVLRLLGDGQPVAAGARGRRGRERPRARGAGAASSRLV